jgi:hypothetical protein
MGHLGHVGCHQHGLGAYGAYVLVLFILLATILFGGFFI